MRKKMISAVLISTVLSTSILSGAAVQAADKPVDFGIRLVRNQKLHGMQPWWKNLIRNMKVKLK